MNQYYEVAVPRPIRKQFTYSHNNSSDNGGLEPGTLVKVPFGRISLNGVITSKVDSSQLDASYDIKPLASIESPFPLLSRNLLDLCRWMSDYYLCSWGEALFNALPSMRKKMTFIESSLAQPSQAQFTKKLTEEQQGALDFIQERWTDEKPVLIHGITGCGKTEVYLRLAAKVLEEGKTVLYLVPEISLIDQVRNYCEAIFPNQIAVFHSRQTDKEKREAWRDVKSGAKQIVLGPRSALFAPLKQVGLIILDEEHDNSYKQDETPRFHARQAAWKRAELEQAKLVMGTATPSVESWQGTAEGKVHIYRMKSRVEGGKLPDVHLVDMKQKQNKKSAYFSNMLLEKIEGRLQKKEGILIFLNRRGFSTQVSCKSCGHFVVCPHCDVGMTYHQQKDLLMCHYCGLGQKGVRACPKCSESLQFGGMGTERIESELARYFPSAKIDRLDRDTAAKRGNLEKILGGFRDRNIDILVGTQMISKGLDFKHLTLVGVISADNQLQLADFRASERTFQILEQVVGRAGRGEVPGEVVLQTYLPDHYSIRSVMEKDASLFAAKELEHRDRWHYPPFYEMINLTLRGKKEESVIEEAEKVKDSLEKIKTEEALEVLGPAPLPFYRLRGYYRWHVMVRGKSLEGYKQKLLNHLKGSKLSSRVYVEIDVDPTKIL